VGLVELWGKFDRLAQPGLGFILCPMEQLVGRLSFRVQQIDVRVETKTLDNVFLTVVVSVQVRYGMLHYAMLLLMLLLLLMMMNLRA